jgi:glycosyltransferase involved in cell wall biosynthesis
MPSSDTISAFFFSTQPEYILIIAILRCLSFILHKDIKIYHQMHEPRYEKGRASLKKSLLVYWANFIMSRLSDRIILSSKQALIKGETFIRKDKIALINLTFLNTNRDILARNIVSLKRSWEILKTISAFGIGARDKNLEGFLALANIINREYPDRVQCIRAGWDKNIQLGYEKEKIIHFPGYITNSAKKFILSLTHIIVVPYQFSTQSGVVIEALSHGKIVVVNNISAFNHLKDLKSVFIVNFNDREQILSCVNKIFSMTPEEYEECYWESINYFNKNHSILYLKDNINKLII